MKKIILYGSCIIGLVLLANLARAQEIERGTGFSPTFRTESTTISANTVHTAGNMGQEYTTGVYVIQIPNPSTSKPPVGTRTLYKCSGAGCTLFITSGSIDESGTTYWTQSAGAIAEVCYFDSGVSVGVTALRGTWTRL
jgi:hypothetical protein